MDSQGILDEILAGAEGGEADWASAAVMLKALGEGSVAARRAYGAYLRDMASAVAVRPGPGADAAFRFVESSLRLDAPDDFDAFMQYVEWDRDPEKRFYLPRRRQLLPVVRDLQDLADGRIDFLSVSMPPRTGKSTLCIFFLVWTMGRNPLHANVMTGYSDKLTKGFHQEALSIITGDEYRYADVFPDAPFADSSAADETISLVRKGRYPSLTCRSADGTLTGAVEIGRDSLLYMDDLVSDREEALNADRMDKLYSIYNNQLKDRMKEGAKQLCVGTRWVPNDPIGRIEALYEGNPRYRFTRVPALDERGESNFDYMYGVGFSTAYYEDMRASLIDSGEEDSWAAKYMAAPYWKAGRMFPGEELRYWRELPEGEPDAVLCACDTKDKGKDFAVLVVCRVYGNDHYVTSVVCDDGAPEAVEPRIVEAMVSERVGVARFESNAAGGRVARDVAKACRERGVELDMRAVYSTANKETRILTDSPWVKQRVLFPADPKDADAKRFMAMLKSYTTTGKNPHDDAPDAVSMYKRLNDSLAIPQVAAVRRPF